MAVKDKVKEIRQHRNSTGGGPPTTLALTPFEERIKDICGNNLMDGDENLKEVGLTKRLAVDSSDSESVMLAPNTEQSGTATTEQSIEFLNFNIFPFELMIQHFNRFR